MASADAAKPSASVTLPLFAKERPLASEVHDWLESAKPLLPSDQRALIDGVTPRAIIAYTLATLPPELSVGGTVTEAMVQARVAARLAIQDSNSIKTESKAAHLSEINEPSALTGRILNLEKICDSRIVHFEGSRAKAV